MQGHRTRLRDFLKMKSMDGSSDTSEKIVKKIPTFIRIEPLPF